MPTEELRSGWTKQLVEKAGILLNGIWSVIPRCTSNDAEYGIDLGDLVYSENELLRIASQSRSFSDRAERVTNYLARCNPSLQKRISEMNAVTKRLFYNHLSDDKQFSWCLNKYRGIELGEKHMQPGVRGLHLADSVSRDKWRKKYLSSPLGAILIVFLHMQVKDKPPGGELTQRELMGKQPPLDSTRVPMMDSAGIGLTGGLGNLMLQEFFHGTYQSFDSYASQKAQRQAEKTANLLRERVDDVLQEHKIVHLSSHDKRMVKCVSIDPDNSPNVDTSSKMYSESLCKIKLKNIYQFML